MKPFRNVPIEKIVPLLHEVGNRLLDPAAEIEQKLALLVATRAAAKKEIARIQKEINRDRADLRSRVSVYYEPFEVDQARKREADARANASE